MNNLIGKMRKKARKIIGGLNPASDEAAKNAAISQAPAAIPYQAPLWLISPPKSNAVPWLWRVPTLNEPVSQLCTQEQMNGPLYEELCVQAHVAPRPHRKVWEFVYILAAVKHFGRLKPGMRFLGFGVGQEPMPCVFASHGVHVVATDAPLGTVANDGWQSTNQHVAALEQLFRGDIVSRDEFDRLVSFEPVDMNAIPEHLTNFDVCWSACAYEHLGSIDLGLDFVENSLKTLKPGGIAVHTTEFNLSSNDETFDQDHLAMFRRQDFERLIERLTSKGHKVAPLNLYPGSTELDAHIDLPPYAMPHLKLEVAGYVTTSFGLIVEKAN